MKSLQDCLENFLSWHSEEANKYGVSEYEKEAAKRTADDFIKELEEHMNRKLIGYDVQTLREVLKFLRGEETQ